MDVKFLNPFVYGTEEVLSKMAGVKAIVGKPYLKTDDAARGDISGVIGMTGDAVGSLALTFSEECIFDIVGKLIGETHKEMNREVIDAVGELTNMISGASRKLMEKDSIKIFAAIPTIVFGKGHTIRHIIKGPSIVIPFLTEKGKFVIDVCLKSQLKQKEEQPQPQTQQQPPVQQKTFDMNVFNPKPLVPQKTFDTKAFDPKAVKPAVFDKPSMPKAVPGISPDKIKEDSGKTNMIDHEGMGERLNNLKKTLAETLATRDKVLKELKEQPFMDFTKRQNYKKALPAYDAKIKRLKLDISAMETISKMTKEELENPVIKPHFQHHANVPTPPVKK